MSFQLLVAQNKQLVEHKADFEMDGRKMLHWHQLAYVLPGELQTDSWQQCDQENLGRQREVIQPQEPGRV